MKDRTFDRAVGRLERRRKQHGEPEPERKLPGSLNPHKTAPRNPKRKAV